MLVVSIYDDRDDYDEHLLVVVVDSIQYDKVAVFESVVWSVIVRVDYVHLECLDTIRRLTISLILMNKFHENVAFHV
jgi:hypothetical protein